MKKIMFNDKYGLTQAVLEGRKTQTRRICAFGSNTYEKAYRNLLSNYKDGARFNDELLKCSLYKVGEEIAIAQKYSELEYGIDWVRHSINKEHTGWNNKMFTSAKEMPHRIKITNVRVERLQDISDEDCMKEGVKLHKGRFLIENLKGVEFYTNSARLAFKYLINKLSGKHTWDSNPYVFVYDFQLIK